MELEQYNFSVEERQENSLKDVLVKYLFNWKWFLISIALCLVLGSVYLRYQTPVYEVNATILIKDDKKGGSMSDELSAFEDLGIFKNNKNIDNEIEILKSRAIMTRVVNELHLNIAYYSFGRPIEHERFYDSPILANYIISDSSQAYVQGNWLIYPLSKDKYVLKSIEEEVIGEFNFGDAIKVRFGKIIFTSTDFMNESYYKKNFRVIINPIDAVVNNYLGSIKINPVNKNSNAITITLRDALASKAAAIVDNLIKQHNLDAIADKNQISLNTANFINERIKFITDETNK